MTDGQGTTKLVTSSNQTITSTQETEAFGRFIGGTGSTASPFGYHGSEGYRSDGDGPAGLEPYQKVGARYYDATFGRFITRDTVLSQSPYAYCNSDPVNFSDPTGHLTQYEEYLLLRGAFIPLFGLYGVYLNYRYPVKSQSQFNNSL
jgi:RHS repeat-associated protein